MDLKNEEESAAQKGSNTEYLPTKCRVTKPPPPKPAANPLQFVKVAPCPFFQKAKEQIKKVEEVKTVRKKDLEETEDWQQNLDNWKSSRRKRQEHIIERVVEVKKLEQEECRNRRKLKTFTEMMGDRSKGRHNFNIPVYNDDDSNDLSDYGIGSSSSKRNSIRDVDKNRNCNLLDGNNSDNKKESSASNQSESKKEANCSMIVSQKDNHQEQEQLTSENKSICTNLYNSLNSLDVLPKIISSQEFPEKEQYTYEGAIQDYRTRIRSKINIEENVFKNADNCITNREDVESILPKGNISKRKEIFEVENKTNSVSEPSRRLSETFSNTQSIKDRLKSLEQCTAQQLKSIEKIQPQTTSTMWGLQTFAKLNDHDESNSKDINCKSEDAIKMHYLNNNNNCNYNVCVGSETPNSQKQQNNHESTNFDIRSIPETEMYLNKLNMFNRDLDLIYSKSKYNSEQNLEDYISDLNFPPSTSCTELMTLSSDREDSGIHTADVSCAVSQSDEPYEEIDPSLTMTKCIQKLVIAQEEVKPVVIDTVSKDFVTNYQYPTIDVSTSVNDNVEHLQQATAAILNCDCKPSYICSVDKLIEHGQEAHEILNEAKSEVYMPLETWQKSVGNSAIHGNVNHTKSSYNRDNLTPVTLFNSTITNLEPPKVKPPPPPQSDECDGNGNNVDNFKRINSTKRIKKEIYIKRSSFLGLDKPTDDEIDPNMLIEKPPDINQFLQREFQIEKNIYKRLQEGYASSIELVSSPDSGIESEQQHFTGDRWDSTMKSSTPLHNRQHGQHTKCFMSEEDEIRKKEQEIIELVEKEEKCKDSDYSSPVDYQCGVLQDCADLKRPSSYYEQEAEVSNGTDNSLEVLHVADQLKQFELKELEKKRKDILFQNKLRHTRHSLENIYDIDGCEGNFSNQIISRKSMPDLEHILLEHSKALPNISSYKSDPDIKYECEKPVRNIQCAYNRYALEYCNITSSTSRPYGISMADLQRKQEILSPPPGQQPVLHAKPPRLSDNDTIQYGNQHVQSGKHGLHLKAVPKIRHCQDSMQPKSKNGRKNYNQHWVFQEAELLRLSQQSAASHIQRQQNSRDQRLQSPPINAFPRGGHGCTVINNFPAPNNSVSTEFITNKEHDQHPCLGHQNDRSQIITCPFPVHTGDNQDKMLSVSGKKKCSNCGKELGRGGAMIIESLCLFYHMECFKCCVCHMRLGDGRMGTDVRVRNQKLHCHNCYSSEDGVKFSCV